jgi:MYXO-CTERM domain-containing protein
LGCIPGDVFPLQGEVPSNALVWFVRSDGATFQDAGPPGTFSISSLSNDAGGDAGSLLLSDETLEQEISIDADLRYALVAPVATGTVLLVDYDSACLSDPLVGEIRVTEPAPLPTELGTLEITTTFGPLQLWNSGGGCTASTHTHHADVSIALAAEALPFADVLRYRLLVDGMRFTSDEWLSDGWPVREIGGGPLGRGIERVYAVCDTSNPDAIGEGVTPGQHMVQLEALLPDGSSIHSDEVAIDLSCLPCADASDGSCPSGLPDASTAGPSDAGPSGNNLSDAAPGSGNGTALDASDSGSNGSAPNANAADPNSEGCNCVMAGSRSGGPGVSLLALGVLAALALRRQVRKI